MTRVDLVLPLPPAPPFPPTPPPPVPPCEALNPQSTTRSIGEFRTKSPKLAQPIDRALLAQIKEAAHALIELAVEAHERLHGLACGGWDDDGRQGALDLGAIPHREALLAQGLRDAARHDISVVVELEDEDGALPGIWRRSGLLREGLRRGEQGRAG